MIRVTMATPSDIAEAVEYSKKDVYCSEQLEASDICKHPWVISLRGPDGVLGAVMGLDIIHTGVATGWAVTTQGLRAFPLAYTRKVQDIVLEVLGHFNLHRLQIIVKCRADLVKWAEHLGFVIEGKMIGFGTDKSDYYIMGRTTWPYL